MSVHFLLCKLGTDILFVMEKENIIDCSKDEFMKVPSFTRFQYTAPLKIQALKLKPLPSLLPNSSLSFSPQLLQKLGVSQQQSSILSDFMGCNSCGVCKSLSKQTLNELNDDASNCSETTRSKEKPQINQSHLNDSVKKSTFESSWKEIKRYSVRIPRVSFQKFFEEKGYLSPEEWQKEVTALFK